MAIKVRYGDRKEAIREELLSRAKKGEAITYSLLGEIVRIPTTGPWKEVLDEISREETAASRPDLTYLVVKADTGYTGQIDFKPANPPTPEQIALAEKITREVWAFHAAKRN